MTSEKQAWSEYDKSKGHHLGYGVYAHDCACLRCESPYECSCWCTTCITHLGGMTDGRTPCPECGKS